MVKDIRESREPRSGFVQFESGDAGTTQDVLTIRDEATLGVTDVVITYSSGGSAVAQVELYDVEEGTAVGSVSGQFAQFQLDPGDEVTLSDVNLDDISEDVVAVVRNNDDDLDILVGGMLVTG